MHGAGLTRQLLLDRTDIYDLVVRYARGVDERDFEMVESCFAPDVRVVGWGEQDFADRSELIDYIRGVGFFDWTLHIMVDPAIGVDGDTATADTRAMLAHRMARPGKEPLLYNVPHALYVEKLERRDGRWVIVQRGGEPAWAEAPSDEETRRWLRDHATDDHPVRWLLDRVLIRDAIVEALPDHQVGNHWVDIDGDVATARTYVITPDDGTPWHERCTVLTHDLERAGDLWKIREGG